MVEILLASHEFFPLLKVYKARRVASMKMMDDGFEEKAESRKAQKVKMQNERKGRNKKQKRERVAKDV